MSELCLFARIAGADVAMRSSAVETVVDLAAIVPVPGVARAILGLSALRSRILTVIDPARVLDADAETRSRRAVVVTLDGHDYALIVDRVADVAATDVMPLAEGLALSDGWRAVARGTAVAGATTALLVDPHALLAKVSLRRAA